MQEKPSLLYLSPVVPALTGNGLAMRAGAVLEMLARHYSVSLLAVPIYPPTGAPVPEPLVGHCDRIVFQPAATRSTIRQRPTLLERFGFRRSSRSEEEALREVTFDVVHVFRLSMLPYARPYLSGRRERRPQLHLDLDDIESVTHHRLAGLLRLNGHEAMARIEEEEAQRSRVLEDEVLHSFDRVYVCSREDKALLQARAGADVCVLPNAVRATGNLGPKRGEGPFTFLFVGTLGYYPNVDAVQYFASQIVPLIGRSTPQPFRLTVVGTGATPALSSLVRAPTVDVIGAVPDVQPYYRDADVVVVPIRAGGGTRIKVLEAFGYGRPVVSTSIGIEGMEARGEEHVLLGETPDAFARQCVRLMTDEALRERLTANALALVRRSYTLDAAAGTVVAPSFPQPRSG